MVGVIQQPRLKVPQRQRAVATPVPQQPSHVQRGDGGWLHRQGMGKGVKAAGSWGAGELESGELEGREWRRVEVC